MADKFGTDAGIQLINPSIIQIKAKAQFHPFCSSCDGSIGRKYLFVLENAIEWNVPMAFCCIPPNCLCPGSDSVRKMYFDRGVWDQQACAWQFHILNGAPSMFANNPKQVCFCTDCCECWNNYTACHFPSLCGDKLSVIPAETCCCCIPTRATWCTNCCGLCGTKSGEPLLFYPFMNCLLPGSGEQLASTINETREAWKARTGKK